jgi:hypothetical protein
MIIPPVSSDAKRTNSLGCSERRGHSTTGRYLGHGRRAGPADRERPPHGDRGEKHGGYQRGRTYPPAYAAPSSLSRVNNRQNMRQSRGNGGATRRACGRTSGSSKGRQTFGILRAGPDDPRLPPRARLIRRAPAPAGSRFFFSIETWPASTNPSSRCPSPGLPATRVPARSTGSGGATCPYHPIRRRRPVICAT